MRKITNEPSRKQHTPALDRTVADAIAWLEENVEKTTYGSVGVTIVLHNGKAVRVEHVVVEKSLSTHVTQAGEQSRNTDLNGEDHEDQGCESTGRVR